MLDAGATPEPERVPEPDRVISAVSQPGDLWIIRDNRLYCDDVLDRLGVLRVGADGHHGSAQSEDDLTQDDLATLQSRLNRQIGARNDA